MSVVAEVFTALKTLLLPYRSGGAVVHDATGYLAAD